MKRGFTLVELSIVLVIIGLLIGGILAAQSMIGTAKINGAAMQIGQFDAMVENFKTKYNYLPGDAPAFGGNGDGAINGAPSGLPGVNNNGNDFEIANFWTDMDPSSYIGVSVPFNLGESIPALTTGPQKSVPASKLGSNGSFFLASLINNDQVDALLTPGTNPRNSYTILAGSQVKTNSGIPSIAYRFSSTNFTNTNAANASSTNSAVKPADLLALDLKIDDGNGATGNVISGAICNAGASPNFGGLCDIPLATCSNAVSGAYAVTNNSYECTPVIRIGTSVNDPQ